jgi:hypothetical protein
LQKQQKILGYFFHCSGNAVIYAKMDWAIFWAIVSQTHQVTWAEE